MRKLLLFLLLGMFLISLASVNAEIQTLGTFKQGSEINLIQSGADMEFCNITSILKPNSVSLGLGEIEMTKDGNIFNYTLTSGNTQNLGQYIVNGYCYDGTGDVVWAYTFEITPLGISQSTSQGIGSFGYLILMITLMFVFGYISFKFFNTENWWIMGIFFGFLSLIFLVYNSWLGYSYHKAVTGLPTSNMPETFFWMLLFLLVLGSLTCVTLLFRHWRKIFKYMKREIKRKEPSDKDLEDWDVDEWAGENWGVR